MRLVSIDRLAPGGAALQPHQRWTVVAGASPELRRRLLQTVRSLVTGDEPECSGVLEVSGVRLALDRATIEQLRLDPKVDPVLSFRGSPDGESPQAPPPTSSPVAGRAPAEPPAGGRGSWVTSTVVAGRGRDDLRAELRSVTTERTRLGERMEEARRHLDSFSRAALEVCRGQIEALEARRSALRAEWRAAQEERSARRSDLLERLAAARSELEAIGPVDVESVRRARAELLALVDVPEQPHREAAELADRLEEALAAVVSSAQRRTEEEERLAAAGRELAAARAELAAAEREARSPAFDPEVVRRLEEVRDEIFSSDDRSGPFGSGRKRRVQELRAEEAVLLDRLGFDTYSAYVMGIPSTRTDLQRSDRLVAARERVAAAEEALGAVRAAAPVDAAPAGMGDLFTLLARAEVLTGARSAPAADDAPVEALPSEVERVIAHLRTLRVGPPGMDDPRVRAAVDAVAAATGNRPALTARDALKDADDWLEEARARASAAADLAGKVRDLDHRLAELDAEVEPNIDLTQLAHVEGELDAALDRLAAAEERVRSHEEAMDRLADLRAEELVLRERERELLAALSDTAPGTGDGPPEPPGTAPAAPPRPEAPTPPPFRGAAPVARPARPLDPHWRLVSRLAEQRAVSFAGALPLVVDGLPEDPPLRDRLLERIDAMSDLVQIVVLSDDPEVARRAERSGDAASVLRVA